MGNEEVLVPVSALEHFAYCPRQCALIHLEGAWDENVFTMRGHILHERVDEPSSLVEDGVRKERAMPIWSRRLKLVGKGDVIEFRDDGPYPVEYKSGRKRKGTPESLQLCAQAICLEEMLGVPVPRGALFWYGSRERREVTFSPELRRRVEETAQAVHEMLATKRIPPPANDDRCDDCSLRDACLPTAASQPERSKSLMSALFDDP